MPFRSSNRRVGLPMPAVLTRASSTVTLINVSTVWDRCKSHLRTEIDAKAALPHLSAYAFHTGLINAITFSALSVWAGFQSANTVQLGVGLARLIEDPGQGLHMLDQQAAASLVAFVFGALLARPAASIAHQRGWLFFSTFFQGLLLGGSTLAIVYSAHKDEPAPTRLVTSVNWSDLSGFLGLILASASVGLQGATAQRLRTPFGPAVPLTSTWVDLVIDPALFELRIAYSREARTSAIFATFIGGFVGRALINALGSRWTLGIAALLKFVMAVSWLLTRKEQSDIDDIEEK